MNSVLIERNPNEHKVCCCCCSFVFVALIRHHRYGHADFADACDVRRLTKFETDGKRVRGNEFLIWLNAYTHLLPNPMFQWNIANFGVMKHLLNFQFLLFIFEIHASIRILLIEIQFWFHKSFFFICVTRFSNFGAIEFYFSPVIFFINCRAGAYEIQSNEHAYYELNIQYVYSILNSVLRFFCRCFVYTAFNPFHLTFQ